MADSLPENDSEGDTARDQSDTEGGKDEIASKTNKNGSATNLMNKASTGKKEGKKKKQRKGKKKGKKRKEQRQEGNLMVLKGIVWRVGKGIADFILHPHD